MSEPVKFPDVKAPLSTYRGGHTLGATRVVIQAMRAESVPPAEISEFRHAALGCIGKDEFLELCAKWVTVE
jgi:hypothetical protein